MARTSSWHPRSSTTVEQRVGSTQAGQDADRLEATLFVEPGEPPRVRLTRLVWGEGVGWFAQHSLDVSLEEAHALERLLGRVPSAPAPEARPPAPIVLAEYRARRARSR